MKQTFTVASREFTWDEESGDLYCGAEYVCYCHSLRRAKRQANNYLFMKSFQYQA